MSVFKELSMDKRKVLYRYNGGHFSVFTALYESEHSYKIYNFKIISQDSTNKNNYTVDELINYGYVIKHEYKIVRKGTIKHGNKSFVRETKKEAFRDYLYSFAYREIKLKQKQEFVKNSLDKAKKEYEKMFNEKFFSKYDILTNIQGGDF